MDLSQELQQALHLHQSGDLERAKKAYRRILAAEPGHFDARHLIGIVSLQQGRHAEAVNSISAALAIRPNEVAALSNLGAALLLLGRTQEALDSYDRALALAPGHPDALGNRANALVRLRRFEEAIPAYDRALAARPGHAELLSGRASAKAALGMNAAALADYDLAVAASPASAETLANRANVLLSLNRINEALASVDRALGFAPRMPEALNIRGNILMDARRFADALASYDLALAAKAAYAEAHNNRGNALKQLHRTREAVACYDKAISLAPNYVDAHSNRANVLNEAGRLRDALASCDRALAIDASHVQTLINRGDILLNLNRLDEAIESYERAKAERPDDPFAAEGIASAAAAACDWDRVQQVADTLDSDIAARKIQPFTLLGYPSTPAQQLACAQSFMRHEIPRPYPAIWTGGAYGHARTRIGYLSADFRRHPVAQLVVQLLETHVRERFEVVALSYGADDASEMRARIMAGVDRFEDIRARDDRAVAQLIRDLELDIVVDLTGHTQNSRPGILAHRAAPVQVNYLGFPATMGAGFMDYVIADAVVAPMEEQAFYSERIVHLPHSYQANDGKRAIAPNAPSRAAEGLPETGFVFCCFNNSFKITRDIFDVWARLLHAVDGSVLWLLSVNETARRNLLNAARARGLAEERLVFAQREPLDRHLARHKLADLFLDTPVYNAHTTGSDALWAGLPMVSCKGPTFAARVGASLLGAAELPELATDSLEAYEALALKLARDPEQLAGYRRRLEAGRTTCPLFDTRRFTRNIEAAYDRMLEIARRGEAPQSFRVDEVI